LGTVWEMSLSQLPDEASTLQKLLAFLDPDTIHESILTESVPELDEAEFSFLSDEME